MFKLPFFTWHNILCGALSVGAFGQRRCQSAPLVRCAAYFPRLQFLAHTALSSMHTVAKHNIMRHAWQNGNVQNCTHLPLFGVMFQ
jgi:hypothetical protein